MAWCQTLCHCQCQSINPSLNGQPQSSVFQSHCVCCHFNQCVGAAVLSHFSPLSNLLLIGSCHLIVACTMSCVCVGFVGVCCVMSSDGVWGDAVCVSLSTPKKGSQHTALFARDGVHQCVLLYGGWWVSVSVWCGVVVWWAQKKGKRQRHSQTKTKRTFPKTTFSLFPFFSPLFHPLFSPCLPLFHHHSLLIHTLTRFSCFAHVCIHGEPKTPVTQHPILFIVFFLFVQTLFSLLFILWMIQR